MREFNFTKKRGRETEFTKRGIKFDTKTEIRLVEKKPYLQLIVISTLIVIAIISIYLGYTSYLRNKAWNEAIDLFSKAEKLINSKEATLQYRAIYNYTTAIEKFRYARKPYSIYYIALCQYRIGDRDEAIKTMENLAIYRPVDAVYYTLGMWYEEKDIEKSKYFYEKLIKEFPESKFKIYSEYKLILLSDDYYKMISELKSFITRYSASYDVSFAEIKIADLYMQRSHLNTEYILNAVDYYKSANNEEAIRKAIYSALIYIQYNRKDYFNINNLVEKYKTNFGNSEYLPEIYKYQIIANYLIGNYQTAIAVGEEAMRRFPLYSDINIIALHLGYSYRAVNKEELAYEAFMLGVVKSSKKAELMLEAGTSLERMKKYLQAYNLYKDIYTIYYDDMNIRNIVIRRMDALLKYL